VGTAKPRLFDGTGHLPSYLMFPRRQATVWGSFFLVLITGILYGPVRNFPFINFDDDVYVSKNVHVRPGLNAGTVSWSLTATAASNWHPLTWLSHALDCQIFGLNPGGHHLTNLLLHCINVVLLYLLLKVATGKPGRSLLVAALFALHPINVESVAWIAERKNLLSTMFFFLCLGAYGWYANKPGLGRWLVVAGAFILGLASKPMVVTLPFVLLLLDYWPLRRWKVPPQRMTRDVSEASQTSRPSERKKPSKSESALSRLLLEKVPLLLLSAASGAITLLAQKNAIRSLAKLSLIARLNNSVWAYGMYIWKTFWPARLAVFYPHPATALSFWKVALSGIFLVLATGQVWQRHRRQPYLATGWFWYLGTLVPVIGIVQVSDQAMADRYGYLPLIGIFVMFGWSVGEWADRKGLSIPWRAFGSSVLLATLALASRRQIDYWQSSEALWKHTLQVTGPNLVAENNLADALFVSGRLEEALPHFRSAVRLDSSNANRHINLGAALAEEGDIEGALQEYEAAARLATDRLLKARAYESLAALYAAQSRYTDVRESYHRALSLDPEHAPDLIQQVSGSVAADPSAAGYLQLGLLLEESGNTRGAWDAYREALRREPGSEQAAEFLARPGISAE